MNTTLEKQKEYTLTLQEASQQLGKSPKTLSRYIRQDKITAIQIKSSKGTLEYRFEPAEIERFLRQDREDRQDKTRQDTRQDRTKKDQTREGSSQAEYPQIEDEKGRQDRTDKTGQTGQTEQDRIIDILEKQLVQKDQQIKEMNERQKETNVLLSQAQDKIVKLEAPKPPDIIYQQPAQPAKEPKPEPKKEGSGRKKKRKKQKQEQKPKPQQKTKPQTEQKKEQKQQPPKKQKKKFLWFFKRGE